LARQRADAVDDWFAERVAALKVQADQRRAGQLRECGVALRAMKERGESVRDIARMAGISEKTARVLIRCALPSRPAGRIRPARTASRETGSTVRRRMQRRRPSGSGRIRLCRRNCGREAGSGAADHARCRWERG
jgi:hypothetical protein